MDKEEIAYRIVDFWHTIEFLSQDSFPKETRENQKKIEKIIKLNKASNVSEEAMSNALHSKKIRIFHAIPMKKDIYDIILDDNVQFISYPEVGSKKHLCIGKIKREFLIKKLYECLKIEDKRPEEDNSEIALFALKVDYDGVYERESFNISPMLWGISKCIQMNGKIQGIISTEQYKKELSHYEDKISKIKSFNLEMIEELYDSVIEQYIKPIGGDALNVKMEGSLIYSRYDSEKTFKREDGKEDNVSDLVRGFYTDDLNMIKKALADGNVKKGEMYYATIDYIIGAYLDYYDKDVLLNSSERIDIRNNKYYIEKWLCPDKAPRGKWPSKFNSALMQQIAINISITNSNDVKKIFSVNGPPGTGKTTLLKEIIASNIVERAKLLCQYESADDAFEQRFFENGNDRNKGYDYFYDRYYVFKEDRISDFGMLVASCNNAAVENITKELPNGQSIIKSLNTTDGNEDIARGLASISELFDITKTSNVEYYKTFEKGEAGSKPSFIEKKDIYFSWLAQKLMSQDDETDENREINEWGIISAPMGKSSNLGKYCYSVLNEIIESFYRDREKVEKRHNNYIRIRNDFCNQMLKIDELQKELVDISHLEEEYRRKKFNYNNQIQIAQVKIKNLNDKLKKYSSELQFLDKGKRDKLNQINHYKSIVELHKQNITENNSTLLALKSNYDDINDNIVNKEDSRKFYEILFSNWIHTERLRQIIELKEERNKIFENINVVQVKIEENQSMYDEAKRIADDLERSIVSISANISSIEHIIKNVKIDIEEQEIYTVGINNKIDREKEELLNKLHEYSKEMTILDDKFWSDFDSHESIKAQISNPWITEKYNRERERLFYLALQFHKEFLLSSKSCRCNLINLAMMWKYRLNTKHELCNYSDNDQKESYSHLLNTLFLLTPVMSTTFASVGRFLKNIETPGSLGLLIIDEAGQAPPHVALGALWRCKKAIVVGDPKQVEPVVTDDADAIKYAFTDQIIKPYMDKTISVQQFADRINKYGSYIINTMNEDADPTWVGCPLVVHRRCINPMFDISNVISYGMTMKRQSIEVKPEEEAKFVKNKSFWINVVGKESSNKNHFIQEQGEVALQIIKQSFENYNTIPDLFVISPFTTVINGITDLVSQCIELKKYGDIVDMWTNEYCGTVHKFQGKEAKEVIFLLGCDENASGAVQWVKSNILNVAVTRAKFRLYVIGDYEVWKKSEIFRITKSIMDDNLFTCKSIKVNDLKFEV